MLKKLETADLQAPLVDIPVVETGPGYPVELIDKLPGHVERLLETAAGHMPRAALKAADAISRRWLKRWSSPYLGEIDQVAARIGRPGAHFFNVHYEWGCTTGAKPSPDLESARLVRVLDWKTHGLGRHVVAARIAGKAGPWVSLTWPGYTGALQAMAPGRFSAAINQAPMRSPIGAFYLDWAANRVGVWKMPHLTPAHLLRRVLEEAKDYAAARQMLIETPICAPAIFTLAGIAAAETCVIERREHEAHVVEVPLEATACAANDWQGARPGRSWARGADNADRAAMMARVDVDIDGGLDEELRWLKWPVLNDTTRLVMIADAARGRLLAQGWEEDGPATRVLSLAA
jgi:hypothetical protein